MSIGPDDGEGCPRCGYNSCICDGFYPFGRLDPDDPLDQAIVRAWNKGASADKHRYQQQDTP